MKKPVKINRVVLKKLINEAVGEGKPDISSIRSKIEKSMFDLVDELQDDLTDYYESLYDEGDPSMNGSGPQEWEKQVFTAIDHAHPEFHNLARNFVEKALSIASESEEYLMDGEYYPRY